MRRLRVLMLLVGLIFVASCGGSDAEIAVSEGERVSAADPGDSGESADPTPTTASPSAGPAPTIGAIPTVSATTQRSGDDESEPSRGERSADSSAGDPDVDAVGDSADGSTEAAATGTPQPGSTSTPSADSAPTAAPQPTSTPTSTATVAPTATPSAARFSDPEGTPEPSPTATSVPPTVTPTPTSVPTVTPTPTPTVAPTATPRPVPAAPTYFSTLPPGSALPSDAECAAMVRADPSPETHPGNATSNSRSGGPSVLIDGAEGFRGDSLAARISGDFTGSTEDILRWAACKWGFDEDLTKARAWTESSWRISTQGDQTDLEIACDYLGLSTPCAQSYGLLQVKGTIHEGTYPYSFQSTAWGVDYAMAWQRACYEGAFTWLNDQGYTAGNVEGCVGAWFSGEWFDAGANNYLGDVRANLSARLWD